MIKKSFNALPTTNQLIHDMNGFRLLFYRLKSYWRTKAKVQTKQKIAHFVIGSDRRKQPLTTDCFVAKWKAASRAAASPLSAPSPATNSLWRWRCLWPRTADHHNTTLLLRFLPDRFINNINTSRRNRPRKNEAWWAWLLRIAWILIFLFTPLTQRR